MQLNYLNKPFFENGCIEKISAILVDQNILNPLICTDPGITNAGMTDQLVGLLSTKVKHSIYDQTPANPTEQSVSEALEILQKDKCDGIIGFGGGSSIDLAKAVALMANHDGKLVDYSVNEGGIKKIKELAPMIAIPTTSGTGSEVSAGSVIIMNDGRKLILASDFLRPKVAICDPELTIGLPPLLTAGVGMDALTHCIEAVLSPRVDPPAEAVGLDGVEKIIKKQSLLRSVEDGQDKDARWNMMMASTEGAMAFSKGLGAVHSMSHALGADQNLRLHHGTLNAVLLPVVLRFNANHVDDKYSRIALAMGEQENADLADLIEKLNVEIGLPSSLKEMGVRDEMLPELVEHAKHDPSNATTPRLPNDSEWNQLFLDAM